MNITKPIFDENEIKKVQECLNSGWVTQGPMVKEFEDIIAKRHKVEYALATTSCTAALHLAVLALGLKPEDEVLVPAFTWVTSAHCAEYVGAKVVFVDIDLSTYNISPDEIEKKITNKTKAIVAVHLFGLSAEMDAINEIAKKHHLYVIEDGACAIGSEYKDKLVGGLGDIGCFSFHPRKVITTGEGGMVTTNNPEFAKKINIYRNHGATGPKKGEPLGKPYSMGSFDVLGFNLRLSDIQAAIGIAQSYKLNDILKERFRIAQYYNELLKDIEGIITPFVPSYCKHTYQSYVIRVAFDNATIVRNRLMDALAEHDIQTRPGTHAVHRLGYYKSKYNIEENEYPNASIAEDTTITLPIVHGMTNEEQQLVVNTIIKGIK